MLMQPIKQQAEIERGHVKSLALVAATFLIANFILVIGFTQVGHAANVETVTLDLARMLAAPEISSQLSFASAQSGTAAAMIVAFLAMVGGSGAFFKNFIRNMDQASRSRI